jgi:hemin uptake protein HemP
MDRQHGSRPEPETGLEGAGTPAPRRISSDALLGTQRELLIMHNGREYHLRLTQNGKLILTA